MSSAALHVKRRPAGAFARTRRAAAGLVLLPIRLYRLVSPLTAPRCKYHPTCSRYAIDAVREVGPIRGLLLAGWRLARCNPWSNGGIDPIEARPFFRAAGNPSAPREGAA